MFRNILVGVDGSPQAERALDEAIDLAVGARARLTILTAVPRPQPWVFTGLTAGPAAALTAELSHESEQILRRATERVPDEVPLTTVLSRRPPAAACAGASARATTISSWSGRAAAARCAPRCWAASAARCSATATSRCSWCTASPRSPAARPRRRRACRACRRPRSSPSPGPGRPARPAVGASRARRRRLDLPGARA